MSGFLIKTNPHTVKQQFENRSSIYKLFIFPVTKCTLTTGGIQKHKEMMCTLCWGMRYINMAFVALE